MASWVGLVILLCVWRFNLEQKLVGARKVTKQEDIELENQLKHAIVTKTIWTIHGEIYDCVDFYKQPAFDHPMLKNHDFHPPQTKPTATNLNIWRNGKGCPLGMVPIRRTTKDELLKVRAATNLYANKHDNMLTDTEVGTHYAVLHTKYGTNNKFHGAGMEHSAWNPQVSGAQYSSSQLKLANGVESIEVGWTVNPSLYNDTQTHRYIHTHAATFHCYNLFCPGFILTRPDIPVDLILRVSKRGTEELFGQKVDIYWDPKNTGKWILAGGDEKTEVGFWPEKIFAKLNDSATYVEWGGKTYSPSNMPSPPMGAGELLKGDAMYDAICRKLVIVNESFKTIDAAETTPYNDDINKYRARGYFDHDNGHVLFYGGRGGYKGNSKE